MKYNNMKVTIDGYKFDSKDEAEYYLDLIEMKKDGSVIDFELQPKVVLIPEFKKNNKKIKAITYKPDFLVKFSNGKDLYVDIKGFSTEASRLRKKMFDYFYPELNLVWLTKNNVYGDEYGWINVEALNKIISDNKRNSKKKLKNNIKNGDK